MKKILLKNTLNLGLLSALLLGPMSAMAERPEAHDSKDRGKPKPDNVKIHGGYAMTALVRGLDYPTAIAFAPHRIWVCEAGVVDPSLPPRIKEIRAGGNVTTILAESMLAPGQFMGPLTDVTFYGGLLWVAHRQIGANGWAVGAISTFDPADPVGTFTTVLSNLPSSGDH